MTARRDVGQLLADQLDTWQAYCDMLAEPYRVIKEYQRRLRIAEAFLHDMDCTCRTPDDDCPKHFLLRVVCGDE